MTEFEKIYNDYFNDVFRYIRRLSGDEHLAEEITAETFFKAMRSIKSFRGDCDIRVWLCQIAKNCCYTHMKKAGRNADIEEIEALPAGEAQCVKDSAKKIQVYETATKEYREKKGLILYLIFDG